MRRPASPNHWNQFPGVRSSLVNSSGRYRRKPSGSAFAPGSSHGAGVVVVLGSRLGGCCKLPHCTSLAGLTKSVTTDHKRIKTATAVVILMMRRAQVLDS